MNTIALAAPSPREMLFVGFRYKRAILLAFFIPLLFLTGISFLMPKVWEADSKVMVRAGREYVAAAETGDHGAIAPSGTMQEAIDGEIEILTSKDVLRETVRAIGVERLYPEMVAPPGMMARLTGLFRFGDDAAPASGDEDPLTMRAVKALGDDLKVTPVKLSNVVNIAVKNKNRQIAVETLRALLTMFNAHHIAAFSRQPSTALDEQLKQNMSELSRLEKDRADYASTSLVFAAGEQRTALIQQREHQVSELETVKVNRVSLEEQVRFIAAQMEKQPKTITLETQTQPSVAASETEKNLEELRAKEGLYAQHFNDGSAILRDLRASIASHEAVLSKSKVSSAVKTGLNPTFQGMDTQLASARTELAPLGARETQLVASIAAIDVKLKKLTGSELKLMDFDRRIAQLSATTMTLRQRLDEARFLDDLDRQHLSSINVIDQADAPENAAFPKKIFFVLGGIALGLASSAGTFLFGLTFRNRFLSVEMVERVLGVPVIAAMPLAVPAPRPIPPQATLDRLLRNAVRS